MSYNETGIVTQTPWTLLFRDQSTGWIILKLDVEKYTVQVRIGSVI